MVDYKEKYEIALEKARVYHAKLVTNLQKEVEDIFPELKENEDERVRKEILDYFKQFDNQELRGVDISSWITWLEKQSKHTVVNKNNLKIEKGKWYVCTQTFVLRGKIVVIKGSTYQAREDNAIHGEDGCLFIDKHDGKAYEYFKAWTIQDAKPGDILATLDYILIFKESTKDDGGVSYCHYDFTAYRPQFNWIEDKNWYFGKEAKVYPATKEQRNLLFSKMEEAGYEWDAEKLKLIEHTNQMSELTEFDKAVGVSIGTWIPTTPEQIERVKAVSNKLLKLARKQIINEQKSAEWSDEDIATISRVISIVKWAAYSDHSHPILNDEGATELVERLKSLKDRYTWKPSKDQIIALRWILNNIPYNKHKEELSGLLEQIKDL